MIETLTFIKGKSEKINQYLYSHEIDCNCQWKDCYFTQITRRAAASFYGTRVDYGAPIIVSSGNRCQRKNNLAPNSSEISNHMAGDAVDMIPAIDREENPEKYEHELDKIEAAAEENFKYVYRGNRFVHGDNRLNKE